MQRSQGNQNVTPGSPDVSGDPRESFFFCISPGGASRALGVSLPYSPQPKKLVYRRYNSTLTLGAFLRVSASIPLRHSAPTRSAF